jgi:hypothetical protein
MPSVRPAGRFGSPRERMLPPAAGSATILVMGVTYELIDAPYPYLCAVYRCRCGAVAVQHANDAATPPELWEHAVDGDEGDYICPGCAERRRAGLSG